MSNQVSEDERIFNMIRDHFEESLIAMNKNPCSEQFDPIRWYQTSMTPSPEIDRWLEKKLEKDLASKEKVNKTIFCYESQPIPTNLNSSLVLPTSLVLAEIANLKATRGNDCIYNHYCSQMESDNKNPLSQYYEESQWYLYKIRETAIYEGVLIGKTKK